MSFTQKEIDNNFVEIWNDIELSEFLIDFIKSINKVGQSVFEVVQPETLRQVTFEDNFVYNLKSKFDEISKEKLQSLNVEIASNFTKTIQIKDEAVSTWKKYFNTYTIKPDLFIHRDQEEDTINQEFAAEVKTQKTSSENIFKDLLKLNIYIEELNYKTAVFLGINYSISEITDFVKEYITKGNYIISQKGLSKIYLISKENFNANCQVISFLDVFRSIDKEIISNISFNKTKSVKELIPDNSFLNFLNTFFLILFSDRAELNFENSLSSRFIENLFDHHWHWDFHHFFIHRRHHRDMDYREKIEFEILDLIFLSLQNSDTYEKFIINLLKLVAKSRNDETKQKARRLLRGALPENEEIQRIINFNNLHF